MKFLTWREWKVLGFHVKKGEKSGRRSVEGIALFSREQVEKTQRYYPNTAQSSRTSHACATKEKWYSKEDESHYQWVDDGFGGEVLQQYHDTGGTTTHFGGPCGPLYTDKFGNM